VGRLLYHRAWHEIKKCPFLETMQSAFYSSFRVEEKAQFLFMNKEVSVLPFMRGEPYRC
jgi:hypothetical protein